MPEKILVAIVMGVCGFGCGGLFYGIGTWALKSRKPFGFWANGKEIKAEDVSDIAAYNRACARMWKLYSIPYWLCGLGGMVTAWHPVFPIPCMIVMILACSVGIWWLVRSYERIWKQYRVK